MSTREPATVSELPLVTVETEFGRLLRQWRAKRGMSQLDLALSANVSTRHISYIENDRSQPTLDMVLRLSEVLGVPLRHRNALVMAAGFAPMYRETGLSEDELSSVRAALEEFLERQNPYPALVVDHQLDMIMSNRAMEAALPLFFDVRKLWGDGPRRIIDMWLSPDGVRPFVANWEDCVRWVLGQTWREAHAGIGDPVLSSLMDRALAFPGVRELWREPAPDEVISPVYEAHFKRAGLLFKFRYTYLTFGTTEDTYVQELRIIVGSPINVVAKLFTQWLARTRGKRSLEAFVKWMPAAGKNL